MKHETFKEPPAIDLSKPSLEGLAFNLRHREMWPATFKKWGYEDLGTCAVGLAAHIWGDELAHAKLGLSLHRQQWLFGDAPFRRDVFPQSITPEMVADDIDMLLRCRDERGLSLAADYPVNPEAMFHLERHDGRFGLWPVQTVGTYFLAVS